MKTPLQNSNLRNHFTSIPSSAPPSSSLRCTHPEAPRIKYLKLGTTSESNLCVLQISAVQNQRISAAKKGSQKNPGSEIILPPIILPQFRPTATHPAPSQDPFIRPLIRCTHPSGSLRSSVCLRLSTLRSGSLHRLIIRHSSFWFRHSLLTLIHFRASIPLASSFTRTSQVPGSSFGATSSLISTMPFSAA